MAGYILVLLILACLAAAPAMATATSQPTRPDTGPTTTTRGKTILVGESASASTQGAELVSVGADYSQDPDLSTSTKSSNKGGESITPGSSVEYTIELLNTGTAADSVTVSDVLGDYYTFLQSEQFEESPKGTLTWSGPVGDESVLLKFTAKASGSDDLPAGETVLSNTAVIQVDDAEPFEIKDETPPKVIKNTIFVPVVMRMYLSCTPNYTPEQACGPLPSGVPYVGYGQEAEPSDYFYINVSQNQRIELTLTVPEQLDLDLWVYDANKRVVAGSSTSGTGKDESVRFRPESGGRHYIRVYRYAGDDLTKPYTLVATY
jgi:hypothetical protein